MEQDLFFELIRVALGTQGSLVGICFVGLKNLGADPDEGYARIGISEETYFTWAGVAAKINVLNEIVNQQCAVVQRKLSADGFECCILKGQGVAQQYDEPLRGFRQSGDIDVWVPGTTIPLLVEYVKGLGAEYKAMYAHVSFKPFDANAGNGSETEVKLHPTPSFLRGFGRNGKLQKWFMVQGSRLKDFNSELGFTVPPVVFIVVYLLLHMYIMWCMRVWD